MRLVEEQAVQRREYVLETARKLLAKRGYEALTMRDLAEACRLSVPTLYKMFANKAGIVREAVQEHFRSAILQDVADYGDLRGVRGHERLLRLFDLCADEVQRLPEYYRSLMGVFIAETAADSDADTHIALDIATEVTAEIRRALTEMREDGTLEGWIDLDIAARQIYGQTMLAGVQWAGGGIDAQGYRAVLLYTSCLMLLGVSNGPARDEFRRRVDSAAARL